MNKIRIYDTPQGYLDIQNDVINSFNTSIGKSVDDIKNICIVGAYHGHEIQMFLDKYPNANILAFEAYPKHFEVLVDKYAGNSRVYCRNVAISDYSGYGSFYELSMEGSGSLLRFQGDKFGHTARIIEEAKVKVSTLIEEIGHMDLDLLWVDVQGNELNVLKGADIKFCKSLFLEVQTRTFTENWDKEAYKGQCYLDDLENFLEDTHELASIGLDNENNTGSGNSFWLKI